MELYALWGFIIFHILWFIYIAYKKKKGINMFESVEEKSTENKLPLTPNVYVVPKNELPFDSPVPKDKISGILFDHDSGTYCLFALAFPEIHLILKTPTNYSQEELERLVLLFTRSFKQKLQVRVFIDDDTGFVDSGIH